MSWITSIIVATIFCIVFCLSILHALGVAI